MAFNFGGTQRAFGGSTFQGGSSRPAFGAGATSPKPAFGMGTHGFGQQQQQQQSAFQTPKANVFGGGGGGFGTAKSGGVFRGGQTSTFGAFGSTQQSSTAFGKPQPSTAFGAPSTPPSGFGNTFGGGSIGKGFGQASPGNSGFGTSTGFAMSTAPPNIASEIAMNQQPTEDIQCLDWGHGPMSNMVAVGCWDGQLNIYQATAPLGQLMMQTKFDAPILDVAFHPTAATGQVYAATADKKVQLFDVQSQKSMQIAEHQEAVRTVHYIANANILMTGSWDGTVGFWDPRSPAQAGSISVGGKVYAADVHPSMPKAVAATSTGNPGTFGGQIVPIDLSSMSALPPINSMLKLQTRCVTIFPDGDGFAVGSIEGRCSIQYFNEPGKTNRDFNFKCHRTQQGGQTLAHSVNAVTFNYKYKTFATAGSDGDFVFWDKEERNRLKVYGPTGTNLSDQTPITAAKFSNDSMNPMLAYARSYDWHKGVHGRQDHAQDRIRVMVHTVTDGDIKPKKTGGGNNRRGGRRR